MSNPNAVVTGASSGIGAATGSAVRRPRQEAATGRSSPVERHVRVF
jgi:NAD(P)-dependent dehydrogenase (short-subunit alcohol dehydrogenase family)